MSTKRRIYVDFDDVLAETARAYTTLLEQNYGKTVPFDAIWSFNLGISFNAGDSRLTTISTHICSRFSNRFPDAGH